MNSFFASVWRGMHLFGTVINGLVNAVLLVIVYVFGVGVTAIAAKLFGKQFLDLGLSTDGQTYWRDLNLEKEPLDHYYRQF